MGLIEKWRKQTEHVRPVDIVLRDVMSIPYRSGVARALDACIKDLTDASTPPPAESEILRRWPESVAVVVV